MVKGVAIEGAADKRGGVTKPVALAIDGRFPLASANGLDAADIIRELLAGSDTGGDLVTLRIDYLAAMIGLGANHEVARALWAGERATIGPYEANLVPALCLWISDGDRTIRINDLQRWTKPDPDDTAATYTPHTIAPPDYERWLWTTQDKELITDHAQALAAWYTDIADEIDAALGRAGLPRYWRDGTGRVAGAMLDKMTGKNLATITRPPAVLDYAIHTGYVGGRVSILQTGLYDQITQVDLNSAYPWAMSQLPSLEGASWVRRRHYDPQEPWGLWRVSWSIPEGASSGPLPVRTNNNAVIYPLSGSGWYWGVEVEAAKRHYGDHRVNATDGYALRPRNEERPFNGLIAHYENRARLRAVQDVSAAYVSKVSLTSCYGKLAQAVQWNGKPGRWGCLSLAGIVTATVRARMLDELAANDAAAIAIATDSLTVSGQLGSQPSPGLGGWTIKTGSDALMLPSGVFSVRSGDAAMDRVSGVERSRSTLIDWDAVYEGWSTLGFGLSYIMTMPVFHGLGLSGVSNQWGRFGTWRLQRRELVGAPHNTRPVRIADRSWRLAPVESKPVRAHRYVPRSGTVGRIDDQINRQLPDVAREHDQPFA